MKIHQLNTGRGPYRLSLAAAPSVTPDGVTLTLSYERIDGLERVGFLCTIANDLAVGADESEAGEKLLERLAPWFAREFEQTREAALKSVRSERKPLAIRFDRENPGPFA
jgi:hypothetical protein